MNFIASPELVTAFAAAGRLSFNPLTDTMIGTDGVAFKLEAPRPAPEVPAKDFERGGMGCILPPPDGTDIVLHIDPQCPSGKLSSL